MTSIFYEKKVLHKREKSSALFAKAKELLPGGVNSPVRSFRSLGITPLVIAKGKGDTIYDIDGNAFIDYCSCFGALILGHAHPKITQAAQEMIALGSGFGTLTPIEEKIASKIIHHIDSVEKIRFVSSGTEATLTALRIARGATGRNKVVKFIGNYHGHLDSLLVQAGSGACHINKEATSKGIPPDAINHTLVLPFNDIKKLRSLFSDPSIAKDIAGVIVEPIAGNMGVVPADKEFLKALREETKRIGALLILDEVITGFRVALKGAQKIYDIDPDLTCFGKVIGGGFPVAAVGGKKEFLDLLAPLGEVYQAGTLSGNPVAMRVGYEVLSEIEKPFFYKELQEKTDFLLQPIFKVLDKSSLGCINATASLFSFFWGVEKVSQKVELNQDLFSEFFRYLFERGIYFPPSPYEACFITMAHSEKNLLYTREVILEFIQEKMRGSNTHD